MTIPKQHKQFLYVVTSLVDASLIYLLQHAQLNNFDKIFCKAVLWIHVYFYICLYTNNKRGIGLCHYSMAASLAMSVFLCHPVLISLSLILIDVVQILWVMFDKCILNEKDQSLLGPYAHSTVYLTRAITIILLVKLLNT